MPIAVPRSSAGNVALMIDSVAGIIKAPPAPWKLRAAMSVEMFGASPHASEESANSARPISNTSRRPYRSASLPPVSMRTANVSV